MQLLLHLLTSLRGSSFGNSKAEISNQTQLWNCPSNITLTGISQDFGPWTPSSNQECSWNLQTTGNGIGAIVSITIANIGLEDSVNIGPVLLTNKAYVKQSFTVMRNTTILVKTGANTRLVMEFSAAAYSIPREVRLMDQYSFTSNRQSFLFRLSDWLPTMYHFIHSKDNDLIVIQRSEDLWQYRNSHPGDLLQWSNVLLLDEKSGHMGSMLDLIEGGKYVSSLNTVCLYLTQPVTLKGALLVNTGYNMAAFSSYGSIMSSGRFKDVTISLGQTGGRSCYTVIHSNPDDTTYITIYKADPAVLITVAEGGPDREQKVTVALENLDKPLTMVGTMWTFYLSQGSGTVEFMLH